MALVSHRPRSQTFARAVVRTTMPRPRRLFDTGRRGAPPATSVQACAKDQPSSVPAPNGSASGPWRAYHHPIRLRAIGAPAVPGRGKARIDSRAKGLGDPAQPPEDHHPTGASVLVRLGRGLPGTCPPTLHPARAELAPWPPLALPLSGPRHLPATSIAVLLPTGPPGQASAARSPRVFPPIRSTHAASTKHVRRGLFP